MNVLVIGGNRFVGLLLAWRLLARGDRVTLLNRGTLADPFGDRVERIRLDRTRPGLAEALRGRRFDATVDFAAFDGRDVDGIVDALGERAGHYVFVSSGQVYLVRREAPSPAREADYDGALMDGPPEGHPDRWDWEYGMGKRAGEDALLRAARERGFPSTRLRIPMVSGERDYRRRVEGYLWRLLDGGPVIVPDGGTRPTRHVYGAEVARAIASLLGLESTYGRAFNLCQDETPTLMELLALMAGPLGAPLRAVPVPRGRLTAAGLDPVKVSPFSGRWMSFLDPSRAKEALGFTHEPVASYYGKIVASFLAHPPADRPEGYADRAREVEMVRRTEFTVDS